MTDEPPAPPEPHSTASSRLPWILGSVALLVIVIIGIIVVSSRGSDSNANAAASDTVAQGGSTAATPAQITAGQKALAAVGCYRGSIDGKYGPATEQSIRDFQRASGLKVDAIFGPLTLAALEQAAAAGRTVCAPTDNTPGGGEPVLKDSASPAGGTVKQLVVPGPETSVLVTCDQRNVEPFFFTDQADWVGCKATAGTQPGPDSTFSAPVMSDVDSPAGGRVKQVTIPGPGTSIIVSCGAAGLKPFLFTDTGTWVGCRSQ